MASPRDRALDVMRDVVALAACGEDERNARIDEIVGDPWYASLVITGLLELFVSRVRFNAQVDGCSVDVELAWWLDLIEARRREQP